jgi:hypothetical protein
MITIHYAIIDLYLMHSEVHSQA